MFSDIFAQFGRAAGRGRRGRAQTAPRGSDVAAELTVPFATAVLGGQTQISLAREDGKIENLTVKIPTGITDGKKLRLRGKGETVPDGAPGDLFITVHVAPHPWFSRRGNDLEVRVPVTLGEAALGAKVDVPTPRGTIALHVPPGTSSGKKLRVKGHGVAGRNGEAGDLYAEIQIVLPSPLDEECLELVKKLDAHAQSAHPQQPRKDLRW
jgi:DnaJ-class molecular chaperone